MESVSELAEEKIPLLLDLPKQTSEDKNVTFVPTVGDVPSEKAKEPTPEDNAQQILQTLMAYLNIFGMATASDKVLLFLGTVATIVHGLCFLALAMILGRMTEPFVQLSIQGSKNSTIAGSLVGGAIKDAITKLIFLESMKEYSIIFLWIALAVFISTFLQTLLFEWAAENQCYHIRESYVYQVLRRELSWFESQNVPELCFTLADATEKVRAGIGHKFSMVLQFGTICFVQILYSLHTNWQLTMIFLTISPLPAFLVKFLNLGKKLAGTGTTEQEMYAKAAAKGAEATENIRNVIAFGKEAYQIDLFRKSLTAAANIALRKYEVESVGVAIFSGLLFASYALAFQHGCKLASDHSVTTTELYTVFFTVTIAVFALGQIFPWVSTISNAYGSSKALEKIMRLPPPAIDASGGIKDNFLRNPTGLLKFDGVDFAYPSHPEKKILENFTMEIKSGQTVGIIGYSASGKTTIGLLMDRFYDPINNGSIQVDGINIKTLDVAWVRSQVAIVPETPRGFQEDTILKNIRAGHDIPMEKIKEVADLVDLTKFIDSLEEGYETTMTPTSYLIQEIQKHQIGIVRAMVRDPTWLILDSVVERFPQEKEEEILTKIRNYRKGLVTIVIAKKTSILKNVDVIHFVKEGTVSESGTYEELIALGTDFFEMYDREGYKTRGFMIMKSERMSYPITAYEDDTTRQVEKDAAEMIQKYPGILKMLKITAFSWSDWTLWIMAVLGCCITGLIIPAFALYYVEIFSTFGKLSAGITVDEKFWMEMIFGLAIVGGAGFWLRNVFVRSAGEFLILNLRVLAFMSILARPLTWFDNKGNSPSSISSKLAEGVPHIKAALDNRFSIALSGLVSVVASIVIALIFGWQLSVAAIVCLQIVFVLADAQVKVQRVLQRKGLGLLDKASLVFKTALEDIYTVQAYSQEYFVGQSYINLVGTLLKRRQTLTKLFALMFATSEAFIYVILAISFRLGCYLIENNSMEPMNFFRVYIVLVFCLITFGHSASFVPDYQKAELAFARVVDLIEGEGILEIKRLEQSNVISIIKGDVKFDKVSFAFPGVGGPIFRELSFEVPAGKCIAIADGWDKTALLILILRFYEIQDGRILIDGKSIRNMEMSELRSYIGYVPKQPDLFNWSIFDNIAYGLRNTNLTENELSAMVVQAAKDANVDEFISKLPERYDTIVEDTIPGFSRLIQAKIAFARALIRNPKILLLDEPTDGYDVDDETAIIEVIRKAKIGRTCIMTTGEPSLAREADLIGMMGQFNVEQFGTHEELGKCPDTLYTAFMERQNFPTIMYA